VKDITVLIIGGFVAMCLLIGGVTYYRTQELEAMKSNIETAISKGIDPIAVRCAYTEYRSDTTCVAYAITRGK
jgi:glucose uptake protein GlcU